jgi:hypothetical protein
VDQHRVKLSKCHGEPANSVGDPNSKPHLMVAPEDGTAVPPNKAMKSRRRIVDVITAEFCDWRNGVQTASCAARFQTVHVA